MTTLVTVFFVTTTLLGTVIVILRLVSIFKSSEDQAIDAEKQIITEQQEVIKEVAEEKHENATPQQLTDFFNRPHP